MSARRRDMKKIVRRVSARRIPVSRTSPARTSRIVAPISTHEEVGF